MFLKIEKKYLTLPNGEKIAYVEKGKGDKVIVLVHGNFSSSYHYEPLYKRIPDEYRVIVPDLRGYGDSSYNSPIDSLHELGDDVVLLLKEFNITDSPFSDIYLILLSIPAINIYEGELVSYIPRYFFIFFWLILLLQIWSNAVCVKAGKVLWTETITASAPSFIALSGILSSNPKCAPCAWSTISGIS